MPKTISLRHVPDDLYRELKARAQRAGLPLSSFLIREVQRIVRRPTIEEIRRRLARRPRVTPKVAPARAVRAERDTW